jgi:phosphopantothenoylcysteine decarboxylase/phosphopantothenate--cysteine ligase
MDEFVFSELSDGYLRDACMAELHDSDVIIKAAAVGDFSAKNYSAQKIKRGDRTLMTLELEQNADIARDIGERKKRRQILAGFAAETENIRENALSKLEGKHLDLVIANDVSGKDSGFASETNSVEIFFSRKYAMPPISVSGSKWETASGILDAIASILP